MTEKERAIMSTSNHYGPTSKKLAKKAVCALFIVAYALFLSIGMECLLNILSISFAISLDGRSVVEQYPRFIPFCLVVGFLALIALTLLIFFNIKVAEPFEYTKKLWYVQYIFAFIISIPMMKIWEMLFSFLQQAF